jgi:hypothetical protein
MSSNATTTNKGSLHDGVLCTLALCVRSAFEGN